MSHDIQRQKLSNQDYKILNLEMQINMVCGLIKSALGFIQVGLLGAVIALAGFLMFKDVLYTETLIPAVVAIAVAIALILVLQTIRYDLGNVQK